MTEHRVLAPVRWWRTFRAWPRPLRLTSYAAGLVVLVVVIALVAAVVVVRRPLPQVDGSLRLAGLSADVTVLRDADGVPQLYGDTVDDLIEAQGYVAAQDRFFQMDVDRHATAGTLAELFGAHALPGDEMARTLGFRSVAEQELALVDPRTRAALEAFSAGVNAYLHTHSPGEIAAEYTVLGLGDDDYTPADWTPVDSLAWLEGMAWDERGDGDGSGGSGDPGAGSGEIARALTTSAVGPARAAQLYPAYPYAAHPPIVDQGAVVDGVFDQNATPGDGTRLPQRPAYVLGATATLRAAGRDLARIPTQVGSGDGLGSNSWVVSGRRSTTGEPLLADDPHLGTSLPGVWMQIGLHCRTVSATCPLDVSGVTSPSLPGVLIGHNADIAWGLTDLEADTSDLYLERVRGDRWQHGGRYHPLTLRTERFEVRDAPAVTLTVRSTAHGPIVSDLPGGAADAADAAGAADVAEPALAVSLQWTGLTPHPSADAILALDTATDWRSFRVATSHLSAPAQSFVYADTAGHIGYQAAGAVPIRKSGNSGVLPADGWLDEDDWTGQDVPFAALPDLEDPTSGFLVAANQAVARRSYPYALTPDWDQGYRSDRIATLIGERHLLSVDDLTRMQLDTHDPLGPILVPYLLEQHLPAGYDSAGQRLLRAWAAAGYPQNARGQGSAAAAYVAVVWRDLLARTFHDELPQAAWPDGGQRWYAVVARLLQHPDDPWWDDVGTAAVEHRDDILGAAMIAARDELTEREALDASDWSWGLIHRLEPTPAAPETGLLARLDGHPTWVTGGGPGAIDATAWDAASTATDPYAVTTAPSMRMVVSLADLDSSQWVDLTGASGHPWSGHYTDQTDLWADGRTLDWLSTLAAVRSAAHHTLTLTP